MNMRSFWWLALAFTLMWIWLEWMKFTAPQPPAAQPSTNSAAVSAVPGVNNAADISVPTAHAPVAEGSVPQLQSTLAQGQRIHVVTDVLDIEIDTQGGDIRSTKLLQYHATADKTQSFQLMADQPGGLTYIAQNGIAVQPDATLTAPTHKSAFKAEATEYVMSGDTLSVPLTWSENGVTITKTYTFKKGEYLVGLDFKVQNQTEQSWAGSLYSQLVRTPFDPDHNAMMYTYTGPVLYDPNAESKYTKHAFDDLDKMAIPSYNALGGWTAMIQHYFMAAIIPSQAAQNNFFIKPLSEGRYAAGVVEPMVTVAAGQQGVLSSQIYMGPIIQDKLEEIAPGLELTVDYGVLTFIAEPIFWLLELIHSFLGNWGWSIIALTLVIKILFYKLSETSYRSMAKMKKFSPKLATLKERYGDDKATFQKKMMELYREEKINPLGGCLPILVQMPVFIALYWVVLYSAEMRQAEWMWWITDLSAKDPYYILPVIMGVTMYIQQQLNPSAMMDEMQQKVMKFLPFIFTVFFMFFPAGLVLYWVVNNILSVAQQWYITKKIEAGEEDPAPKKA
ncbi:membrane protein insertase YidC [Thiosulfativibrio zosterae]|uniref:Membrane protein insertase YidC n=1 Tax=Thiosulfativibrio zosterae TaxID=2675053 RepID=A0A6F8PRF5_9GAMM|nr:membrane protein insertase YidC [Thiosulfativibrio zosterae]BBP44614.1 membrane protein insertase YidC [Thiosulfativibrio zosterae]